MRAAFSVLEGVPVGSTGGRPVCVLGVLEGTPVGVACTHLIEGDAAGERGERDETRLVQRHHEARARRERRLQQRQLRGRGEGEPADAE